jgi:hypothetical protein
MNSHNLTEEEREQNKGRAQILNIINRDVFDVAVAGECTFTSLDYKMLPIVMRAIRDL